MCETTYFSAAMAAQVIESHMSFEVAITIVLAALTAVLTALAIGIGVVAIFGYAGMKESLGIMATNG